jgi:LuxR family maltose regulon positive regulatory protein
MQNRVAWLSLDEGDNDPARFLRYLVGALQTGQPGLGEAALAMLREHPQNDLDRVKAALTALLNELATLPGPLLLILDDYHLIQHSPIHDLLAFLLDHLPQALHLVIAGRAEPSLPLARLRLQGRLLELGPADLRFTLAEAATLLNQVMGLALSAADIATLETRTEGWVAGLQLAALSMQDRQDVAAFMASFSGSHRYVIDYLAEEVLHRQPPAIQQFLLQTSILSRLCGPLGDAVVELEDSPQPMTQSQLDTSQLSSQQILSYLEQANLFIIPLDDERRWYRYHHLFSDFLRNRLEKTVSPAVVTGLHRRAAAWYEQNDLVAEATGHALAIADVSRATRLIERRGRSLLNRSELTTLLGWLEVLPGEMVRSRPRLSLFHAWALVLTGQFEAVEARLADLEQRSHGVSKGEGTVEIPGEATAIRATLAYFRRDLPQAITLFRQTLDQLPEENLFLRGAVAMSLATAYILSGDLAGARGAFEQGATIHQANDNLYMTLIALWNLALLHGQQGQLHQAAAWFQRALQVIARQSEQGSLPYVAGRVQVDLAGVFYQWNQLEEATAYVAAGLALGQQSGDPAATMSGYLMSARIKQAQGQMAEAGALLRRAEQWEQAHDLPGWRVWLGARQVQHLLGQSDVETAVRWAYRSRLSAEEVSANDSAGYRDDLRRIDTMTQARLLIAQHRAAEALAMLTPLLKNAEATQRTGPLIELLVLQALAQQQGDSSLASQTLERALLLAEPEDFIRCFIDEGEGLISLLRQARMEGAAPAYIDQLLAAHQAEVKKSSGPAPLIESLSERELEILQLIEDGLSNQQIAETLFLTVGTVKWHINNMYGKLGVRRRTQAVALARELNLL